MDRAAAAFAGLARAGAAAGTLRQVGAGALRSDLPTGVGGRVDVEFDPAGRRHKNGAQERAGAQTVSAWTWGWESAGCAAGGCSLLELSMD